MRALRNSFRVLRDFSCLLIFSIFFSCCCPTQLLFPRVYDKLSTTWMKAYIDDEINTCCSVSQSCLFFVTPRTAACQAFLSTTNSWSLLKFMSIELVMPTVSSSVVPLPPAFNLSHHQGIFQRVSSSHQVTKVLEFQLQHQSFQ